MKIRKTKKKTKKQIETIDIKGASEHNLKNICVSIPKNKLIVFSGYSGSGKSSLVFDVIYSEGKRRYLESLSTYARQFLGQMDKPKVDSIEGLSPAISIKQKVLSHNPRSTVGTVTEIYDYLRILFARLGKPYCYVCNKPIEPVTSTEIIRMIMNLPEESRIQILFPVTENQKGEAERELDFLKKKGYVRVLIDGELFRLDEDEIKINKHKKHFIDCVLDRFTIKGDDREERIRSSVELALKEGKGVLRLEIKRKNEETELITLSEHTTCTDCNISLGELTPQLFSFNSPLGMCTKCNGLGVITESDPEAVIEDEDLSISEGALKPFGNLKDGSRRTLGIKEFARINDIDLEKPFKELPQKQRRLLLFSPRKAFNIRLPEGQQIEIAFEGAVTWVHRFYQNTTSEWIREQFGQFLKQDTCKECNGKRLRKEALSVKFEGRNIAELSELSLRELYEFLENLDLKGNIKEVASPLVYEIKERLRFLIDVGVEYLNLARTASSLSGGESQRIRLASQIGSGLSGIIYALDEPTIGLHPRDNQRLIALMEKLRDKGNTLLVIEHDRETLLSADLIIDMGPGAGIHGGEIVEINTPDDLKKSRNSITGDYLSNNKVISFPQKKIEGNVPKIILKGANLHNLKNINVEFPLGHLICVTGVSGSGKSSLVNETLFPILYNKIYDSSLFSGPYESIEGVELVNKIISISQDPIGRTPRSNPATYTKVFDFIRNLLAKTPSARALGFTPGRFSFNVQSGRCPACNGDGVKRIEMHFLPDVYITCDECKGTRYKSSTLQVTYKGLNIAEILDLTIDQAIKHFSTIPQIVRILNTLSDVGLGYIKLGQPAPTLSGGEAQRIKLSRELAKRPTGHTMYTLDEPTTGLHFADLEKLLRVLIKLRDQGNTILVIEHNLDFISQADYIIDLGPEGGHKGGEIVATGTVEEITANNKSLTGYYLKKHLHSIRTSGS
ncbi:MAG: excinuclease ABC subunit UvrA [Candidatus Coatesbacteria bacterium]|nr:excinuclease ABC subunit UvrA [Candidatus Coatesbacteria bacterium]